MRQKLRILPAAIVCQPVYAHVPEGQDGLLDQLLHQLLGAHHLAVTLALIAALALLLHRWRAAKNSR